MQDTTTTYNSVDTISLHSFVYTGEQPIFVLPNQTKDSNHITGFNDYVVKTLNNNLPPLQEKESIFKYKTFVGKDMTMKPRQNNISYSWMYGVVFSILLIYLVLMKYYARHIGNIIKGDENQYILLLPVVLLFIPIISLMGFLIVAHYDLFSYFSVVSSVPAVVYLLIMAGVFAYCFVKYILIAFFGALFRMKGICNHYNSIQIGFYLIDGLVMLPSVFLCFYLPQYTQETMLIVSLCIFAILMLIRLLTSLTYVLRTTKFSKVYLFFYLCTLEFMPLIIIYKLLSRY